MEILVKRDGSYCPSSLARSQSYDSVVNFYNATDSLVRFENKNIFPLRSNVQTFKPASLLLAL
jgi:hypothetical protein